MQHVFYITLRTIKSYIQWFDVKTIVQKPLRILCANKHSFMYTRRILIKESRLGMELFHPSNDENTMLMRCCHSFRNIATLLIVFSSRINIKNSHSVALFNCVEFKVKNVHIKYSDGKIFWWFT